MRNFRKQNLPTIIVCLIICAGLFFLITCSDKLNSQITGTERKTTKVRRGNLTDKLRLTGKIIPSQIVEVKSRISGEVKEFLVQVGDSVRVGDVIAFLNPDPKVSLDVLKKDLNLWKKNLEYEKQERLFKEKENLYEKGLISREEYQNHELDYKIIKKELDILKLDMSVYKNENGLNSDNEGFLNTQRAKIVSSIEGIVLQVSVQKGDFVRSALSQYGDGTILCSIGKLNELLVESSVSEYDVHKIKTDQQVEISLNNSSETDIGIVQNFFPIAAVYNSSNTFTFKVNFTPQKLRCYPGMSAHVNVILGETKNVLLLPLEAIIIRANTGMVFVPGTAGPKLKRVVVGSSDNHFVEILSGLEEGMEVYTNPNEKFKEVTYRR